MRKPATDLRPVDLIRANRWRSVATLAVTIFLVPLLEIRNLTKVFPAGRIHLRRRRARWPKSVPSMTCRSIFNAGETLGLVGESGSGKSTLGRLVLRLIEPTSGSIRFEGRDLLAASPARCAPAPRHADHLQDPFGSLDPRMRVEDVIAEPLIIHENCMTSSHESRRPESPNCSAPWALTNPRCAASRTNSAEASGSASALPGPWRCARNSSSPTSRSPRSTSASGAQIVNLLAQLQREFGLTYLFISHSMPVVRYLATRIAVMYRGKIVEVGPTEQITERPQHPYTRSLLEATPEVIA